MKKLLLIAALAVCPLFGVEQVENFNGVWIVSSPAAITSIVLGVGTDDFGVGTVATLYGEQ